MYEYGYGVDQNDLTAVECYSKAAEQVHADAQFHLGYMNEYGYCVDENDSTAEEWYRKAAKQGHTGALFNLGKMYHYGQGVEQKVLTVVEWSTVLESDRKAAEMLERNLILERCMKMDLTSIKMIQQQ